METIPDSFRDLLTAEFATLATVGKWGGPHQSIVWFLAEGRRRQAVPEHAAG